MRGELWIPEVGTLQYRKKGREEMRTRILLSVLSQVR
jgi:hypothetical protein